MAKDLFRSAARKRQTLFNAWLMLNNPLAIELIGDAGWDCVTIDHQHGAGGNETMLSCLTAAKAAGLPAIVRVANNDPGLVGRALDAGAQGVMCPLIENVAEAESFVQAVKYPPRGNRSWGPYRQDWATGRLVSNRQLVGTIACPQTETWGSLRRSSTPSSPDFEGVDMVYFGPNDPPASRGASTSGRSPGEAGGETWPRHARRRHDADLLQRRRIAAADSGRLAGGCLNRYRLLPPSRGDARLDLQAPDRPARYPKDLAIERWRADPVPNCCILASALRHNAPNPLRRLTFLCLCATVPTNTRNGSGGENNTRSGSSLAAFWAFCRGRRGFHARCSTVTSPDQQRSGTGCSDFAALTPAGARRRQGPRRGGWCGVVWVKPEEVTPVSAALRSCRICRGGGATYTIFPGLSSCRVPGHYPKADGISDMLPYANDLAEILSPLFFSMMLASGARSLSLYAPYFLGYEVFATTHRSVTSTPSSRLKPSILTAPDFPDGNASILTAET